MNLSNGSLTKTAANFICFLTGMLVVKFKLWAKVYLVLVPCENIHRTCLYPRSILLVLENKVQSFWESLHNIFVCLNSHKCNKTSSLWLPTFKETPQLQLGEVFEYLQRNKVYSIITRHNLLCTKIHLNPNCYCVHGPYYFNCKPL